MRYLTAILTILAITSCATNPTRSVRSFKILGFGILNPAGDIRIENSQTSTSGRKTSVNSESVCETTKIPMKPGVRFGIVFTVHGIASSEDVLLKTTTTHPPITGYDGKVSTVDIWKSKVYYEGNNVHYGEAAFLFEEPYELKEGKWSISVEYGGDILKKVFDVKDEYSSLQFRCKRI